jgi:hypothetical protein
VRKRPPELTRSAESSRPVAMWMHSQTSSSRRPSQIKPSEQVPVWRLDRLRSTDQSARASMTPDRRLSYMQTQRCYYFRRIHKTLIGRKRQMEGCSSGDADDEYEEDAGDRRLDDREMLQESTAEIRMLARSVLRVTHIIRPNDLATRAFVHPGWGASRCLYVN